MLRSEDKNKATFRFFGDPQKHKTLVNLLPLSTPLSLHIDPSNICNLRCSFCPTGHPELLKKTLCPRAIMDYALFTKIIDDLKRFPDRLLKLHLYKDGEPLLNPAFSQMVRYAKSNAVANSVETSTNGLLLSDDLAREIADAGLDRMKISIQHISSNGYKAIAGARISYDGLREKVGSFYRTLATLSSRPIIHVKLLDTGFSDVEKQQFLQDFSEICDEIHIDSLMGWSRSETFDFKLGQKPSTGMNSVSPLKIKRLICPQAFYTMAVNADGTISICCVDWAHETVIGNVNEESLDAIWTGERMQAFRKLQLEGRRNHNPACANCSYVQGMPDSSDLDAYKDMLMSVYGF